MNRLQSGGKLGTWGPDPDPPPLIICYLSPLIFKHTHTPWPQRCTKYNHSQIPPRKKNNTQKDCALWLHTTAYAINCMVMVLRRCYDSPETLGSDGPSMCSLLCERQEAES